MTSAGRRSGQLDRPATLVDALGSSAPRPLPLGPGWVFCTGRADGDMGHGGTTVGTVSAEVARRRGAVVDLPWSWLRQVHGDRVVTVRAPGDQAGERADAAVTGRPGCTLVVLTGDCAPVALASAEGVLGVAHAGWRGMVKGVVQRTVDAMRALGATDVQALVGPCIGPECYEFGPADLDRVAAALGDTVRGRTEQGRPALDLPAAAREVLVRSGVSQVTFTGPCTGCSTEFYSWRRRGERERQATVVWR